MKNDSSTKLHFNYTYYLIIKPNGTKLIRYNLSELNKLLGFTRTYANTRLNEKTNYQIKLEDGTVCKKIVVDEHVYCYERETPTFADIITGQLKEGEILRKIRSGYLALHPQKRLELEKQHSRFMSDRIRNKEIREVVLGGKKFRTLKEHDDLFVSEDGLFINKNHLELTIYFELTEHDSIRATVTDSKKISVSATRLYANCWLESPNIFSDCDDFKDTYFKSDDYTEENKNKLDVNKVYWVSRQFYVFPTKYIYDIALPSGVLYLGITNRQICESIVGDKIASSFIAAKKTWHNMKNGIKIRARRIES